MGLFTGTSILSLVELIYWMLGCWMTKARKEMKVANNIKASKRNRIRTGRQSALVKIKRNKRKSLDKKTKT